MILDSDIANKVAENLLQIKAIKLNTKNPFTWASGLKSPIYCDNRITLSYPVIRTFIKESLTKAVKKSLALPDVIAGVATAGIPQGVLIAQQLELPFIYVRPDRKSHGMTNIIEGYYKKGQKVVVVEDLVSTGKSSLLAVDSLREAGMEIMGMVTVFTYGLEIAEKNFEDKKCSLITLSDYGHLIEQAVKSNYIKENDKETLMRWRNNPQLWSDKFIS